MSKINFEISIDKREWKTLLNTLLRCPEQSPIQSRLGQKIEFIIENIERDEKEELEEE
jgi:hypothetical protein